MVMVKCEVAKVVVAKVVVAKVEVAKVEVAKVEVAKVVWRISLGRKWHEPVHVMFMCVNVCTLKTMILTSDTNGDLNLSQNARHHFCLI